VTYHAKDQPDTHFDITEQIAAEEEIRQSEQRFRSVWENSLDGMRLTNSDGIIISVNDAFCRMVGKKEDDLIGKHFFSIYSPDDQSLMKKKYCERFRTKSIDPNLEREIQLWDGSKLWLEVSNSFIESDEQDMLLLSIFRDITERKKMINRLKMFEDSIKSVNDGICITDLDANIIMVNQSFCDMFGYHENDMIGKSTQTLWSVSDKKETLRNIFSATLQGGWKGETINRRKDGTEFPLSLSTSVIRDDADEPVALIGVVNDISVQKRMEEQMHHAQKMDSIGVLVGGISHHFNNILNIIVGYTSLIEQDHIDREKLKKFIKIISEAAERGADLVHQLMTFVKKSPMRTEPICLDVAVQKTVDVAKETFPKYHLFDIHFGAEKAVINADPNHLRQAMLNILLNARDAMPQGGTITLKTYYVDEKTLSQIFQKVTEPLYICIEITDTGIGIKKDIQSRIFEPFFTTKDFGQGVGLGLPMVYGMVESHGGFIDFRSEPGKGTSFLLYFPVLPGNIWNNPCNN